MDLAQLVGGGSDVCCYLVQCVSVRYADRLAEAGIEPSVGNVGESYNNALAEPIGNIPPAECGEANYHS